MKYYNTGDFIIKIFILNGPNLNCLGTRETSIYGTKTLTKLEKELHITANKLNMTLDFFQSNSEGELITALHECEDKFDYIIFNPGAYTHYSYALRDAVSCLSIPVIEIHITNIYNREEFRSKSVIAPVCLGQISGFGISTYEIALQTIHIKETSGKNESN